MTEIWKHIPGYEESYSASNLGRIRSEKRKVFCGTGYITIRERILKQSKDKDGYPGVNLSRKGKAPAKKVHRLILLTFKGSYPLNSETRHLDGDKTNNQTDNLDWGTHMENVQDTREHEKIIHGEKIPWSKLTDQKVREIRKLILGGDTHVAIAKKFGVCRQTINKVISGKSWKRVI